MRSRKTEQLLGYAFWDTDGLARHFEKRAAQGWLLERFDAGGYHYRRGAPQALRYAVFLDPAGDCFAPELTEGQRRLSDFCAHDGWQLLTVNGCTVICVSPLALPKPLQTDPVTALKNLDRVSRRSLLYDGLLLLLGLLGTGAMLHRWVCAPLELLLDPARLLTLGICGLTLLLGLTQWVGFLAYRLPAGRAAREGRWLPTRSPRPLIAGLYGMMAVLLAVQFFAGTPPDQWGSQLLHVLLRITPILLLYAVMHLLKQSKTDADTNRHISLGVYFVASLVLVLFLPDGSSGRPLPPLSDPPALTVADLTGTPDDRYQQDHYLWKSSCLVTETRASDIALDDFWGQVVGLPELYYTQLDVHKPWVYGLCLRDLLHTYDWASKEQPDARFIPLVPTPPGLAQAYVRNRPIRDNHAYLFCLEDRLILLQYTDPLTSDQLTQAVSAFINHT